VLTTKLHAPKDHYSRGETSERILFISPKAPNIISLIKRLAVYSFLDSQRAAVT
jgi:hypothetical protein